MIREAKEAIKARWPLLRLRTIVFATLFMVAALPGIAAMFLRVYENTLVRQTEAELIAQGAALVAIAETRWPGGRLPDDRVGDYRPEVPRIDLSSSPILDERPAPDLAPYDAGPADQTAAGLADELAPVFARTKRTTLSSIMLLDREGRIATGADGGSLSALPEVRSALSGRSATVLRRNGSYRAVYRFEWLSRAAAVRVHHARPIVAGGRVVGVLLLSRSARSLFKGLYADRGKIVFGIAAILVVLVVLSAALSRGIVRPVEQLGRATHALAIDPGRGRGSVPQPPRTAAIEIQDLYRDFARMAEAIERRSRYLRDFAHAVSHEFKTPLSGIRGALEILEDHGETMSRQERARFLANADADAARLSTLTARLLDLARADLSVGIGMGAAELGPVLERMADSVARDGFALIVDCPGELPAIAIPDTALDAILRALIENSHQAGAKSVAIGAERVNGRIRLSVADDGPGIPEIDRTRIFEPFFTTRRSEGGSGLGLSIVASLIEAAGGVLQLGDPPAGGGARFLLDLPMA